MGGQYIEAMLWPRLSSQCEVCRRWGPARFCQPCIERFASPGPRCPRCALRVPAAAALCGSCLRLAPPFEHTVCVADYVFPWDRLIVAMKFHEQAELSAPLSAQLAAAVRADGAPLPDLVLPVPLARQRLAERGYNQAWELARRVAAALGLPAHAKVLLRPVETAQHQAELSREQRLSNLRGAFAVDDRRRKLLTGRRVSLVDDVLTTGATAQEATLALLRAGACAVDLWVLARTPQH